MKPRLVSSLLTLALLVGVLPVYVPQALAFPHKAELGGMQVWSDEPVDREVLGEVLAQTDALVSVSPIAVADERRRIFLTDGGWRWNWLALQASGSFAFSRAGTENIVVNASDVGSDRVINGNPGASRRLSAVLAHEIAHGMMRRRYGFWVDITHPQWLREGYADYVAQESTLTADDVADLEAQGSDHPALPYYHGRRRVAAMLAENGGSVDALFGRDAGE